MKAAILVDSTASLAKELANHPDVYQVDLKVIYQSGEVLTDTTDPQRLQSFYQRISREAELPTTSQPEPAQFSRVLDEIVAKGYDTVYGIHLSGSVSGTLQTAQMFFEEYQPLLQTYLIDSKGTSFVMEEMVKQALQMIDAKFHPQKIQENLEWIANESVIYVMVEDLKNLVKGGRLSLVGAALGSALQIRPIIYFTPEGRVGVFEKMRTNRKVFRRWQELVDQAVLDYPDGITVAFAHGDAAREIEEVKAKIQANHPDLTYRVGYLTPVLGVHGGKGCKGMGIIPQVKIDESLDLSDQ